MNPTRVLFIVGSMDIGGVQSGIMSFIRITPPDQIHFEVIVLSHKKGYHEAEFRKYGNVYPIPLLKAPNKYLSIPCTLLNDIILRNRLSRFLKAHTPFDAIHTKLLKGTAPAMEVAKKRGVSVRIAQSHVDRPDRLNPFDTWYYRWCARRIERCATVKLAVSKKAADLLFDRNGARVIKNPTVDLKRLNPRKYNCTPHSEIRLIQIGTFSNRKNQCFSVNILKQLLDMGQAAKLFFIGYPLDGSEYVHEIEKSVAELGLEGSVVFLPRDTDVPLALSRSDYMLIPSLREGLPNVALEGQAMGVPCFLSDAITKAADCGLCVFLPLEAGAEAWAREVLRYRAEHGVEKQYVDMSAWDQREVVKEYIQIWQGHNVPSREGNERDAENSQD